MSHAPDPSSKPTSPSASGRDVVFIHGWCGHADEVESIREALPGRVLPVSWMPAAGSLDLEAWPLEDRGPQDAAKALQAFAADLAASVRRTILDSGFAGATLVGHSMGGGLACVLAADPELAVRRVVLLDSSVPMLDERRDGHVDTMIEWIDRAATSGRLATQAGWIAGNSGWVPDFFALDDQGPDRLRIERRLMFAPVVEAAATIGGGVQWPINESLSTLQCPVHAIAGNPGRMPVEALRDARPDAEIVVLDGVGHYPHRFAAEAVRTHLTRWITD